MISTSSLMDSSKEQLLETLWASDKKIHEHLCKAKDINNARDMVLKYLDEVEHHYFHIFSPRYRTLYHIIERNNAKDCIRIFKNIIRTENEQLTSSSALELLFKLAQQDSDALKECHKGFICEFIFLFRGINGKTEILTRANVSATVLKKKDALNRSHHLDRYSDSMTSAFKKFRCGTDKEVKKSISSTKTKILSFFGATENDWNDYKWHLSNIIRDKEILEKLVTLTEDEKVGMQEAQLCDISVQITPYYLSLFLDGELKKYDDAIRAQVIPTKTYCRKVKENKEKGIDHDFMGEKSTSPVPCVTRRYPQIVILKPYDSCPQICVYCQRNWEITNIDSASVSKENVDNAIEWISKTKSITEVLVTGGDPLTLEDERLDEILYKVSEIKHVERIRIGTRTIVTLPMRITPNLISILKKYHQWGKREVSIMTHVEHAMEITDEVLDAVRLIKEAGMNIYNQQVFTYHNSRRFESCFLRKIIKVSGIDPYYSFNTKGKEETIDYRVPISRIEQERKEEARLLPGLQRTDEPVFNVPKLGKSHLRAVQDHEPIMILPDGKRVYRFYPWESKLALADDYLYTDTSIYEYLERLKSDGENIDEYQSMWYYF
ncbi:KamA family radical SAM protein [Chitinispirillales bacterium ANBcel5]|uniref:KamA family radical SAM protein n=1 Tax=Cellulosispirillum alkaliphilum TaxID=3039283 RepID=UPI002A583268|nr:KamA family radical SAM protein [Chitinispirillales bacterium ANBcel5]